MALGRYSAGEHEVELGDICVACRGPSGLSASLARRYTEQRIAPTCSACWEKMLGPHRSAVAKLAREEEIRAKGTAIRARLDKVTVELPHREDERLWRGDRYVVKRHGPAHKALQKRRARDANRAAGAAQHRYRKLAAEVGPQRAAEMFYLADQVHHEDED